MTVSAKDIPDATINHLYFGGDNLLFESTLDKIDVHLFYYIQYNLPLRSADFVASFRFKHVKTCILSNLCWNEVEIFMRIDNLHFCVPSDVLSHLRKCKYEKLHFVYFFGVIGYCSYCKTMYIRTTGRSTSVTASSIIDS